MGPRHISTEGCLNRRTLIMGEVGTGKTLLTKRILDAFVEKGETSMALIDMAPPAMGHVGGKMNLRGLQGVRYYTEVINAPRLTGKTMQEAERLARENAIRIEGLLSQYERKPCLVLFINDVSIYLQAGDAERLWEIIQLSPTVVLNGYYGISLGDDMLSRREREKMEWLAQRCDKTIFPAGLPGNENLDRTCRPS